MLNLVIPFKSRTQMFDLVNQFEKEISKYFGSPYAVSTDCCTHAIELCLIIQNIKETKCPRNTYLSIPMTLEKLNIIWTWTDDHWEDYYYLKNTNIIDAAVLWKKDSYISNTLMCVSFQYKKHLSLGRGGMILLDNYESYKKLIKLSYDGRSRNSAWMSQNIDTIGYHYYMTPETAELGLRKLDSAKNTECKKWSYLDYPDLSNMSYFKNVK